MDHVTIRDALPDDAAAISALAQRTVRISNAADYQAHVVELIVANFAADRIAERMAERRTFVARAGGRIVGTVALGADRLRTLFVEPELQGSGLGARLVAHLEDAARQAGVKELKLSSSLTAQGFYARLGYRTVQPEEHDGIPTILMAKTLA